MEDIADKTKDMNITVNKVPEKKFGRRDHIREIEIEVQKKWAENKIYEVENDESKPKFFVSFPYPYMNGRLHLGHAFSLTKAEFTARFQRLQGKNVLFPFAFHCTGMPIQAAANKLKDEIETYGNPPVFPAFVEEIVEEKSAEDLIAAKSKGKKSKLIAKGAAGGPMRQWDILAKMVPLEEVSEFADPMKWLNYFPPYGASDLEAFGSAIDWRRSFITTSANPCYDAFIRWQFNRLREANRIKFGKRANVFSITDKQVCADHDRASGEGVGPQEYTIIKLEVIEYPENSVLNCPELKNKKIYLAPATLRPETMYGQTNCFVLPEGNYGAFEMADGDIYVISERSAKGLAYQGFSAEWGVTKCLLNLKGTDLIGLPLKGPLCTFERIYTLPLLTISMGKGTGVVTSVPSDAPDDYVALRELKEKPLWREKYGLTAEMVEPYDVVPVVEIEGYGNCSAVFMCEKLDIKSPKDTDKLKQAKEEVYLKGFYEGVMIVGTCKGMKVCDAKPIIRKQLIDSNEAIAYFEPESLVMSRSGDECVVALTDQWYLSYGEEDWMQAVSTHIHSERFNGYNDKIMEKFDFVLGWLKEWACSRQFGLGTKLPWDQQWVIESLSDSTIYMAYYTIAHYLHGGIDNMTGENRSPYGIKADDLTDDVFSYIFLGKAIPEDVTSNISTELLNKMRNEFDYWYPMDLRVSAKDLIPNHLTMCLYNHVAVWNDQPEKWPKGIYCNGHVMVDAEKMSKSKGNFLMMLECIELYSADATRFALADAGDSMEDANFDREVANKAISALYTEEFWIKDILVAIQGGELRDGEYNFMDSSINNEIDYLIEATTKEFEKMCYRDGLQKCWMAMTNSRDLYRDWSSRNKIPMHKDILLRYCNSIIVLMAPITPHWSENLFSILGNEGSVCSTIWPKFQPYDRLIKKQFSFFQDFMKNIRQAVIKNKVGPVRSAYVYIANVFEPKKVQMLNFLLTHYNADTNTFTDNLLSIMKDFVNSDTELKKDTKVLMQFGAFMRDEAFERGPDALAETIAYDQKAIIQDNLAYIQAALDFTELTLYDITSDTNIPGKKQKIEGSVPGKPTFDFVVLK